MQQGTHYKTKLVINILIASMTLLLLAIFLLHLNIPCVFKKYFHFSCPACGLTRSFYEIFKLKFITSLKYNLLGIPLFISIIFIYILYFIDIFFKKNYLLNIYERIVDKYYIIIIILILNMIINNIKLVVI